MTHISSTDLSETEWRKRIQRKIKEEIPDEVWKAFKDDYIEEANLNLSSVGKSDEQEFKEKVNEEVDSLAEDVKRYLKLYRIGKASPKLPSFQKTPQQLQPREIPPDKRFQSLTRIIGALANKEEDVIKFRREILNDKLLKPEEVPIWIEERAAKENHTHTISFDVDSGVGWEDRLLEEVKHFVESRKAGELWYPGTGAEKTVLAYPKPPSEWVDYVVINKKGVLGRLKHLTKKYQDFWNEAETVHFILTGIAFPISHARVGTYLSFFGLDRVTLEVSPHLPGDKVKKLYLEMRKDLLNFKGSKQNKKRMLTEKHLTLAVFAVEEKGSWAMKLRKWNKKYPQWAYPDTARRRSTFARDCRAAYERLTGWKWSE